MCRRSRSTFAERRPAPVARRRQWQGRQQGYGQEKDKPATALAGLWTEKAARERAKETQQRQVRAEGDGEGGCG